MPSRRLLLVALVLGLLSALGAWFSLRKFEQDLSGGRPTPVLTALRDLEPGDVITAADLAVREVPAAYLDNRTVLARELERVVGIEIVIPMKAQQTLQWTDLAVRSDARNLSQLIAPGKRAVTIRAKSGDESGSGLIKPGDYVDVLAVVQTREAPRSSIVLLQRVLVVAVGGNTEPSGGEPGANARSSNDRVLTLSLDVDEAQLLALAKEQGQLSVTLRNPTDSRIYEDLPDLQVNDLLEARDRVQIRKRSGAAKLASRPNLPARLIEAR